MTYNYLAHMKAAGAWMLYSLEAESEAVSSERIRIAEWHLEEARKLRLNTEQMTEAA